MESESTEAARELFEVAERIVSDCFDARDSAAKILEAYKKKCEKEKYSCVQGDVGALMKEFSAKISGDDSACGTWLSANVVRIGERLSCIPVSILYNKAVKTGHDRLATKLVKRLKSLCESVENENESGSESDEGSEDDSGSSENESVKKAAFYEMTISMREEMQKSIDILNTPLPAGVTYGKAALERRNKEIELLQREMKEMDKIISARQTKEAGDVSQHES